MGVVSWHSNRGWGWCHTSNDASRSLLLTLDASLSGRVLTEPLPPPPPRSSSSFSLFPTVDDRSTPPPLMLSSGSNELTLTKPRPLSCSGRLLGGVVWLRSDDYIVYSIIGGHFFERQLFFRELLIKVNFLSKWISQTEDDQLLVKAWFTIMMTIDARFVSYRTKR